MVMSQNGRLAADDNDYRVMGGTSSSDNATIINSAFDPATRRLLTDSAGGGAGTVTQINEGVGIELTPDPITTTGSVALTPSLQPLATLGTAGQVPRVNAGATALEYYTPGAGAGDVVGPASATDNAVARFDGTTGKLIQNSAVTIADTSGDITGGKYNGLTVSTTTGTLTIANGKTVTHNATTTFAGTDGKTLTISNSGTLAGGDAFVLAIAAGKTLTVSNTLTFTGTDGSSVAFGTGGTVLYTASTIPLTVGSTTIASGTTTRILYDNAGVLGEYTLTGTGTVVVMATSPTFTTGLTTPQVLATANDSGALGASGTAFADLFLASGGVINWAANNSNITHSTGILTVGAGEFRITSANVGTNADSVPTLSSTSTLTNKTLTAPTLGGATSFADGATYKLIVPTVDGTATGPTTAAFVSGYTSSAIGDLVYLDSNAKWQKTDADAASTASNLLGVALAVAATDAALLVALPGSIVYATAFPTLTIGAPYYVGETAGAIQATIPTGADNVIRVVGFAVHADKLFFYPSQDNQTTVA